MELHGIGTRTLTKQSPLNLIPVQLYALKDNLADLQEFIGLKHPSCDRNQGILFKMTQKGFLKNMYCIIISATALFPCLQPTQLYSSSNTSCKQPHLYMRRDDTLLPPPFAPDPGGFSEIEYFWQEITRLPESLCQTSKCKIWVYNRTRGREHRFSLYCTFIHYLTGF